MVNLTVVGDALCVTSPYNRDFVDAIKSLPPGERKFDASTKRWMVDARHGAQVAQWLAQYYGARVTVPAVATSAKTETTILECRYIGATKDRGDGKPSASGWAGGDWSVVLPEDVLKAWFLEPENTPAEARTLYNVLGAGEQADPQTLKGLYRRLAKQWHPDVCREPNANEQMRAIQHAYDILSNPQLRARYDAGLRLERSLPKKINSANFMQTDMGYRSPLRCGLLMVEATRRLGRWNVSKILGWEDIVDARGRTLVTSWRLGDKTFTEEWL